MQQNDGAEKWWISGMAEYPKKRVMPFSMKQIDSKLPCVCLPNGRNVVDKTRPE